MKHKSIVLLLLLFYLLASMQSCISASLTEMVFQPIFLSLRLGGTHIS